MNTKQWVVGTIGGGVVLYVLGYVIFDTLLVDFYGANRGSATDVVRDPQIHWAVGAGVLAYAALIIYTLKAQAASLDMTRGFKVGAVVGCLLWLCADFTIYGVTNINNLTLTIVDPLAELVRGGLAGAALALLLPKLA